MTSVLVVLEQDRGVLRRSACELLRVASQWPFEGQPAAVVLGTGAERAAQDSTRKGVRQAYWLDEACAPMRWLRAVEAAARETGTQTVLFADSSLGRDLAPRLALRTHAHFLPGVLSLDSLESGVRLRRQVFGGRFFEEFKLSGNRNKVLTWRGGDVGGVSDRRDRHGEPVVRRLELAPESSDRLVLVEASSGNEEDLTQAEIVVCGGRGVGSREGFKWVYTLAKALGGAPAASRAAVDAGFAPVELQVGQSGKTVSPRFYFALGVSGSLQHRAGMHTSQCVVAVNSDPAAPILSWADYGMVGDVAVVVPQMIEALRR